MNAVKTVLLLSAAITVVLRLFVYENALSLSTETVKLLNIICVVSAVVCVACASIWVAVLKIGEKKNKKKDGVPKN